MLAVNAGQGRGFVCRYPFDAVFLQPLVGGMLQILPVSLECHSYPCGGFVVVHQPSDLTVNQMDLPNYYISADILGYGKDICMNFFYLAFQSFPVGYRPGNISLSAFSSYNLVFVAQKLNVPLPNTATKAPK